MESAVRFRKPIVVLRHPNFKVSDIPATWAYFKTLLMGPRTIECDPQFLPQIASKLKKIRMNPQQSVADYYKENDLGRNILLDVLIVRFLSTNERTVEIFESDKGK